MAEVAAVSSIGGLLSLTIQVIQISKRYVSSVKNASKTIKGYFRELEIMRLVLTDFKEMIKHRKVTDSASLDTLILESFSAELEHLRSRLSKRSAGNSVSAALNRLTWPFAEDETRRLVEVFHRYQSSLHALLSAENCRLTSSTLATIELVKARQDQDVKERILKWLSTVDPLVNHSAARDKHETTTGNWFLVYPEFMQWKDGLSQCIWIRGIPGAGKTVLCSTIIDHLIRTQKADEFVLYFYFDFRDDQKQKLDSLLRSLIAQFCVRADNVPREVEFAFDQGGTGLDNSSLTELFISLSSESGAFKIVLDALDESSERLLVLNFLQRVSQKARGNMHWLVTSRREQDIENVLGALATATISLSNKAVESDIRLHVESCLLRDPKLNSRPLWIKDQISDVLVTKAHGMFRWVDCQLVTLRQCLTAAAITDALADLPVDIDATYTRMLNAIDPANSQYVQRALLLLAFSIRPMHVEEVAEAAVIIPFCKPFDPGDRLFDSNDIIALCAGLVTRDENTDILMLAHYSVQEFLISQRILQSSVWKYALLENKAQETLAVTCMTYIISVSELTVGYHGIMDDYPLLEYSCKFWLVYAQSFLHNSKSEVFKLALHLLDGRLPASTFWLTYHDHEQFYASPLRAILFMTTDEFVLALLRHPGFIKLPRMLLRKEVLIFLNDVILQLSVDRQILLSLFAVISELVGSTCIGQLSYLLLYTFCTRSQTLKFEALLDALTSYCEEPIDMTDLTASRLFHNRMTSAPTKWRSSYDFFLSALKSSDVDAIFKRVLCPTDSHGGGIYADNAFCLSMLSNFYGDFFEHVENGDITPKSRHSSLGSFLTVAAHFLNPGDARTRSIIENLLAVGMDVNMRGGELGTALIGACANRVDTESKNNTELVDYLIYHGADVNARGHCFASALHAAVANPGGPNVGTVASLISAGSSVLVQCPDGTSLLRALVNSGSLNTKWKAETFDILVASGAQVQYMCLNDWQPPLGGFSLAALDLELSSRLPSSHLEPEMTGSQPLLWCKATIALAESLILNATICERDIKEFHFIRHATANLSSADELLRSFNSCPGEVCTGLDDERFSVFMGAKEERERLTEAFNSLSARVDDLDRHSDTALHTAVRDGNLDLTRQLLLSGMKDRLKTSTALMRFKSALDIAVENGHEEIFTCLLKADPEALHRSGASGFAKMRRRNPSLAFFRNFQCFMPKQRTAVGEALFLGTALHLDAEPPCPVLLPFWEDASLDSQIKNSGGQSERPLPEFGADIVENGRPRSFSV